MSRPNQELLVDKMHRRKLLPKRTKRWSRPKIIAALRAYEQEHGQELVINQLAVEVRADPRPDLPSQTTVYRHFGSWRKATKAAYGHANSSGWNRNDADTEAAFNALVEGTRLSELARERGISPQALGRRVADYQRRQGLEPRQWPRFRKPKAKP